MDYIIQLSLSQYLDISLSLKCVSPEQLHSEVGFTKVTSEITAQGHLGICSKLTQLKTWFQAKKD